MKAFVVLLLPLTILSVLAQDTSNTTTRVSERRNPDGTLRWRMETTLRDKTPVLLIYKSNKAGVIVTSRSYMVGGQTVMTEVDDDGDGAFETIAVYRRDTSDMEVFTRHPDGSVRPVSAKELAVHKKQHAAIVELWDKAFEQNTNADKFVERARETQQKIRDAKADAKK